MRLDRRLWLTADKDRVVEDGDPEAAFLLGTEGKEIPDSEAERLGLKGSKKPAVQAEPEPEVKEKPAPANKARKRASSK